MTDESPPEGGAPDVTPPADTDPPAEPVVADLIGTGIEKPEDIEDSPEPSDLEKRFNKLEKKLEKKEREQILNSEEFVKYKLTEKYKKASLAKLKDVQEGLLIGRANFDVTRNPPKDEVKQIHGYLDRTTMTYK